MEKQGSRKTAYCSGIRVVVLFRLYWLEIECLAREIEDLTELRAFTPWNKMTSLVTFDYVHFVVALFFLNLLLLPEQCRLFSVSTLYHPITGCVLRVRICAQENCEWHLRLCPERFCYSNRKENSEYSEGIFLVYIYILIWFKFNKIICVINYSG